MGKAVKDAAERYFLENNSYATSIDELDVSYSCPATFICKYRRDDDLKYEMTRNKSTNNGQYTFVFGFDNRAVKVGSLPAKGLAYCAALIADKPANDICRTFGSVTTAASDSLYNRHMIN